VLGYPDRPRPAFGDQDADDVPGDGREGAVVEHGGTPLEQPPLLQLRGPAGPAELVVPPPPHRPDDEDAQRAVPQRHPQEHLPAAAVAHRKASRYSGGANGSRPTSSAGGPDSHRRRTSAWSGRRSAGSPAQTPSTTSA